MNRDQALGCIVLGVLLALVGLGVLEHEPQDLPREGFIGCDRKGGG